MRIKRVCLRLSSLVDSESALRKRERRKGLERRFYAFFLPSSASSLLLSLTPISRFCTLSHLRAALDASHLRLCPSRSVLRAHALLTLSQCVTVLRLLLDLPLASCAIAHAPHLARLSPLAPHAHLAPHGPLTAPTPCSLPRVILTHTHAPPHTPTHSFIVVP